MSKGEVNALLSMAWPDMLCVLHMLPTTSMSEVLETVERLLNKDPLLLSFV